MVTVVSANLLLYERRTLVDGTSERGAGYTYWCTRAQARTHMHVPTHMHLLHIHYMWLSQANKISTGVGGKTPGCAWEWRKGNEFEFYYEAISITFRKKIISSWDLVQKNEKRRTYLGASFVRLLLVTSKVKTLNVILKPCGVKKYMDLPSVKMLMWCKESVLLQII